MIAATYVARAQTRWLYTVRDDEHLAFRRIPYLLKNLTYDPIKDFTPIARTGDLPFMLVINPEIPANSVQELIALAKKEPGKYSYASGSSRRSCRAPPSRALPASTCCTFRTKVRRRR